MEEALAVEVERPTFVVLRDVQDWPAPLDRLVALNYDLVYAGLAVRDDRLLVIEGEREVDRPSTVEPIPVRDDVRWQLFDCLIVADERGVNPGAHA